MQTQNISKGKSFHSEGTDHQLFKEAIYNEELETKR